MKTFLYQPQPDAMDCGATCLAMIAKHYGKTYTIEQLREMCAATREGVSMLGISDAAEKLGFKTLGVHVTFEKLMQDAPLPCIVHWKQEHFVVVYRKKTADATNVRAVTKTIKMTKTQTCGFRTMPTQISLSQPRVCLAIRVVKVDKLAENG